MTLQQTSTHFGLQVQTPETGAWFFVKRNSLGKLTYGIYPISVVPASELAKCQAEHPLLIFAAVPLAKDALEKDIN